jgi:hypothetical protein
LKTSPSASAAVACLSASCSGPWISAPREGSGFRPSPCRSRDYDVKERLKSGALSQSSLKAKAQLKRIEQV